MSVPDPATLSARQANVQDVARDILTDTGKWGLMPPHQCEALAARLLWMRRLWLIGDLSEFGGPGR